MLDFDDLLVAERKEFANRFFRWLEHGVFLNLAYFLIDFRQQRKLKYNSVSHIEFSH